MVDSPELMVEALYRLTYDATADEIVDVAVRLANRSQAFRRVVRLNVWVGGTVAALVLVTWVYFSNLRPASLLGWVILFGCSAGFGAVFSYFFRREFEKQNRKLQRRIVVEQMAGKTTIPCELELRDDCLWVRQQGLEMTMPWNQSTGIEENESDFAVWFNPLSVAVIRHRLFSSPAERQRFLERARALAKS